MCILPVPLRASISWIANPPSPADYPGYSLAVNGLIYFLEAGSSTSFLVYDPTAKTWTPGAEFPARNESRPAGVIDCKLYFIGKGESSTLYGVDVYDLETASWTRKATVPVQMGADSVGSVNGKVYTLGGWPCLPLVQEYDPVTDTWTRKADMPTPRRSLAVAAMNGRLYAIGGWSADNWSNLGNGALKSNEEYDPTTDTWRVRAPMNVARWWPGACAVGGTLYAAGGIRGYPWSVSCDPGDCYAGVEAYDPMADKWIVDSSMTVTRDGLHGLSLVAVNGILHAVGGNSVGPFETAEEGAVAPYTESPGSFTATLSANPSPAAAGDPFTVILTISNKGGLYLTDLEMVFSVAAGDSLVAHQSGPWQAWLPDISAGTDGVYQWTFRALKPGSVSFRAGIDGKFGSRCVSSEVSAVVEIHALESVRVYPNPFQPARAHDGKLKFEGVVSGRHARIYTVRGLMVWEGEANAMYLVEWDGKTRAGKPVSPGTYMWVAEGARSKERGTLIVE